MRTPRRPLLVPLLAFLLTVGAAVVVVRTEGDATEAHLYGDVAAHLDALRAGPPEAGPAAEGLAGLVWIVEELALTEDETEANVRVRWVAPDGRQVGEDQLWRREGASRWLYVGTSSVLGPR